MKRGGKQSFIRVGLVLIPLALTACGGQGNAPASSAPPAMPPAEVEVVQVQRADLHRSAQLPGRLQASRTAQVRARVEGILEKQFCVEGDTVKAGELLFRIEPTRLAADVEVAEARVEEKIADAAVASQTLERVRSLVASKAVSAQSFDEAEARHRQAEAAVAAARAELRRARLELQFADVRAPISGHLGRAQVTEGALVGKDEATLLITIEQTDPIRVNFAQSSADYLKFRDRMLGDFKPGTRNAEAIPVTLILEDTRVYPAPGVLKFTDVVVDTRIGSVGMRADFPNPEGRLLPGQFVGVRIPFRMAEALLVVPQRAVITTPAGQFVYRVNAAGIVEMAPVVLGGLNGDQWIVDSGLAVGDTVIVNGVQKVRPGSTVKAVPVAGMPTVDPAPASEAGKAGR